DHWHRGATERWAARRSCGREPAGPPRGRRRGLGPGAGAGALALGPPGGPESACGPRYSSGSIVLGPLEQCRPTTSAPACSTRAQASSKEAPSIVVCSEEANVTTAATSNDLITSTAISASPR